MVDYTSIAHWTEFARLLECGCFDAIFLADVIRPYDTYSGNRDATLICAGHLPINDPMLLVPAMAAATEHLGFGLTSSIMQYHPFSFARLFSTLDHLSKGRVAWNIVTSFTQSTARNFGCVIYRPTMSATRWPLPDGPYAPGRGRLRSEYPHQDD